LALLQRICNGYDQSVTAVSFLAVGFMKGDIMSEYSQESDDSAARAMMDNLYWWGIASLFRAPIAAAPTDLDIALVGVPHSTGNGTTERDQHLGPRAVRHVSANMRRAHMRYGFYPLETGSIADIGDVPLPEANNNEACIKAITRFFRSIDAAGARPVSIGGDHSVTGGILRAISGPDAQLTKAGKSPCCILMHIPTHLRALIIFWGRVTAPRIGPAIWCMRGMLTRHAACRLACVAMCAGLTGSSQATGWATMSSPWRITGRWRLLMWSAKSAR
jgi:hypothetical protein